MFGFAYGGVMPLYAIVVREYFGERIMGSVFGAVSARGHPRHGARALDRRLRCTTRVGSYAWMFIGSSAIGFGAVAIAFTFRPPSGRRPPRLAPRAATS